MPFCGICKRDHDESAFYRNGAKLFSWCKGCYNKRQWDKIKSDPEQYAKRLERNRAFKKRHRAKLLVANRAWYAENPEKQRAAVKRWINSNPERWRALQAKRRAREVGPGVSGDDIRALMKAQKSRCVVCRIDLRGGYHLDHVMPLALGGLHDKSNVQLLCPKCNTSKSAKHPVDFMQSRGFLI